jgi:acetyl-CoA carboxylase carboxyl transferase subunit alpha
MTRHGTRPDETTLTVWQVVELARHANRPYSLDYIRRLAPDFIELHGDRLSADDPALVAGVGTWHGRTTMFFGHQKGRSLKERVARNWGMMHPEGYRKALRLIRQAEKFQFPVVALVDTPAAFPGAGAEERGIAWAIADNLIAFAQARTPIVTLVLGEGGSGGALGIGVGDRLLMMQHSIYSVAPPETCASILWRDISRKVEAAEALKLTAADLQRLGLVDEIVPEPTGGAQTDYGLAADAAGAALRRQLSAVESVDLDRLLEERYQRYRRIGIAA